MGDLIDWQGWASLPVRVPCLTGTGSQERNRCALVEGKGWSVSGELAAVREARNNHRRSGGGIHQLSPLRR